MFIVKIPSDRFEDADQMLLINAEKQVQNVERDYYLFDFTNAELIDVVNKKEEWNHFDTVLAKHILNERNIAIPHKEIYSQYKPARLEYKWLIAEYIISIAFIFIGIIIGTLTLGAYRNLPNGKKEKLYDYYTLKHAKIMIVIGIIRTSLWIIQWLY